MKRRQFVQLAAASALGASLFEENCAFGAGSDGQLDRFGGWKGKRFDATGFFRTEHDGRRWWLVTPEGNAFLSFGINHFQEFTYKWNKDVWQKRLGANMDDMAKFSPAYRAWALEVCRDYGINTLAMDTDHHILNDPAPTLPYMQKISFLKIDHWEDVVDEDFRDVFSRDFATRCDLLAREIAAPLKDDPFLLGYSLVDCPTFTEVECAEKKTKTFWDSRPEPQRIGFPRRLRNLGAQAPGKQAYVQTVREIYNDNIKEFNATYETRFDSFDALAVAADWRPDTDPSNENETRDNSTFMQVVVTKYYETTLDAIRRYDPNHMFAGDRLNGNTDVVDKVLHVTSKYTDFVFFQMYNRYEKMKPLLDSWSKIVDKPFFLGDGGSMILTDTPPPPRCSHYTSSKTQWIEWTDELFRKSFARPDFVGWHYCGTVDSGNRPPKRKGRQKSLMDGNLDPYPELREVLRACTDEMYSIAVGE